MRPRLLALALAATIALTGCLDGDDDEATMASSAETTTVATTDAAPSTTTPESTIAPTGGAEGTATTAPPTTAAASAESEQATTTVATTSPTTIESTTAPTTPPTTAPEAGGDCLIGRWVITEAELNAYYDSVEAGVPGATFNIMGSTGLEFTESTYTYTPAFTLELEVAGTVGTGETSGTVAGTYTTEDGVLYSELTDGAIDIQVDVGGVTMDGSDIGNGLLNTVPFIESPYSCDGPTIMFETTDDGRHPVRLTPAG